MLFLFRFHVPTRVGSTDGRQTFELFVLLVFNLPEVRAISEFQQYFIDPRENLAMLENYPDVKNIFIKYNTLIPSSDAGERLFSIGNLLLTARRNCLSDLYFQHVL